MTGGGRGIGRAIAAALVEAGATVTVLDDGVRITYHATVLAGVHVAEQGMVGAMAVATKDVRGYHVYVGIPAKSVRVKPNAPHESARVTSVRGSAAGDGGSDG